MNGVFFILISLLSSCTRIPSSPPTGGFFLPSCSAYLPRYQSNQLPRGRCRPFTGVNLADPCTPPGKREEQLQLTLTTTRSLSAWLLGYTNLPCDRTRTGRTHSRLNHREDETRKQSSTDSRCSPLFIRRCFRFTAGIPRAEPPNQSYQGRFTSLSFPTNHSAGGVAVLRIKQIIRLRHYTSR